MTKYLSRNKTGQCVTGNQINGYFIVLLKLNLCYDVIFPFRSFSG
jgi:predicted metalloenzyme YecM